MTKDTKRVETLHVIEQHEDGSIKLHELELYKSEDGKRYFRTAQPSKRKFTCRELLSILTDEDFAIVLYEHFMIAESQNYVEDRAYPEIYNGIISYLKKWLGTEIGGRQ